MIAFPANVELVVVHTPVSFSCGIDGMRRYCQIILQRDPIDCGYFLFKNRCGDKARVLWFDGQGFCLFTKRLSKGCFREWPKHGESASSIASFFEAQALIAGGNIAEKKFAKVWKKIA